MKQLTVPDGAVLLADTVQSAIMPGDAPNPFALYGETIELVNSEGYVIGLAEFVTSYSEGFESLGDKVLESNVHPHMRSWPNAHELLTKYVPGFGMADKVTVYVFKTTNKMGTPAFPESED